MNLITYFSKQEPILFAVEELKRLLEKAGIDSFLQLVKCFKDSEDHQILLITRERYESLPIDSKLPVVLSLDGYSIVKQGTNTWIIGEEPRSVLYGIYKYCEMYLGYRWTQLDQEEIVLAPLQEQEELSTFNPTFQRRGNIIETIDDSTFINSLIDWGVKNGHNEYFFTFFLWEKVKRYVAPTLKRRGVKVTLGGHSLQFILNEIGIQSGKQENIQFFTRDKEIQEKVIQKIVAICKENEVISRISLWPEDVGIGEKNASDFMSSYILFTENLNKYLKRSGLQVEVEHIVYNAGLSWSMLEREKNTNVSSEANILFAYWGRNYAESIESQEINQQRASHALKDWNAQAAQNGRNLTVLEYYSDHFMLSELFPPLARRIDEDLRSYQHQNVSGILNLIVPPHMKDHSSELDKSYPWKWVQHFNNYIYTKLVWGQSLSEALEQYFQIYTSDSTQIKETFLFLEEIISPHTKWNVPLFPARVVDPEKVTDMAERQEVAGYLKEIGKFFGQWDFEETESLLSTKLKNAPQYTPTELANIYFYFLKTVAARTLKEWNKK
ncbi:alpha-glucuronidase family glycosyl hydrolase [Psychrobacillus sp. FSL W7-1457]|uniref:alpha-glucuronidase family glycosyl hydrolase n=1 Tax=Psychrobacillus sp. FSL W7-1457 TaxID=2954547 RepID=UPI003159C0FC